MKKILESSKLIKKRNFRILNRLRIEKLSLLKVIWTFRITRKLLNLKVKLAFLKIEKSKRSKRLKINLA